MEIILIESVKGLGSVGSLVSVKDGYARNFLIPKRKALRATKENIALFEAKRAQHEEADKKRKGDAEAMLAKLQGISVELSHHASDDGKLYGAVSAPHIAKAISAAIGEEFNPHYIDSESKVRHLGVHQVHIILHPDVKTFVELTVTRGDN